MAGWGRFASTNNKKAKKERNYRQRMRTNKRNLTRADLVGLFSVAFVATLGLVEGMHVELAISTVDQSQSQGTDLSRHPSM